MDLLIGGVTSQSWFFSFFGPETVSSVVVFFFTAVSTCREGKLGVFFSFWSPISSGVSLSSFGG